MFRLPLTLVPLRTNTTPAVGIVLLPNELAVNETPFAAGKKRFPGGGGSGETLEISGGSPPAPGGNTASNLYAKKSTSAQPICAVCDMPISIWFGPPPPLSPPELAAVTWKICADAEPLV